jgi:serine/threonine protein kinase
MSPEELHQRVRGIFDKVLDRPESERRRFLRDICSGDDEIFRAVERLLNAHDESSSFPDPAFPDVRRFGRYVISRELGRGAMGIVYEAADPLIGRSVAVKIIRLQALEKTDEAEFLRDRLFREARSAGSLSHPGIVTIFDVGFDDDVAFIAMERVNGPSLQEMLRSNPRLDYGKVLDILRQTAAALDYAHQRGVIHRDIKPANIMVHEGTTVKITDFGIAKIVSNTEQTRTGVIMGTPSHMSPEQIEAKPLNGRSDQFSLAAVAFRLLTGAEAFHADTVATLLHKILNGPRPLARATNPTLPPGVDKVLQRGLEKDPAARYGTCTEFVRALDKAIEGDPVRGRSLRDTVGGTQGNSESLAETLTVAIEPPSAGSAATTGRFRSRTLGFALVSCLTAGLVALAYFSGVLPYRRTPSAAERQKPAPEPKKPATSPAVAEVKPSPAPPIDIPPSEPVNSPPNNTPPSLDKSARARQIYAEAVKYRNAKQQVKAIDLFRQAANLGEIRAMVELGETLMNDSDGAAADYPEALRWLRKAAEAGNSAGMVDLGGMYLLGNGVEEDFETAARWFEKGAAAGNPAAMYDLGAMYENGQGIVEDHDRAKQLFSKAAGLGNAEAKRRLAELVP